MRNHDNTMSNSFAIYLCGYDIMEGGQHLHDNQNFHSVANELNIGKNWREKYDTMLRYGVAPHGGCSLNLELLVMSYLKLERITEASLFPRNSHRLKP